MGFACDFEGAGFVLKLPVLTISKIKIAKAQENKRTNSPSYKGEWLKAEGVKAHNSTVVLLCFFYGKIVPLLGGRAACGGGGKVQFMRVEAGAQKYFFRQKNRRT